MGFFCLFVWIFERIERDGERKGKYFKGVFNEKGFSDFKHKVLHSWLHNEKKPPSAGQICARHRGREKETKNEEQMSGNI